MGKVKTLSRENLERINYDITSKINAGDEALEAKIKEATDALEAEKASREAADTDLQSQVTAEVAARIAGDAELQTAIESEAEERATKDSELEASITSEVARATSKEEEISTNLANEITRATGREDDLQTAIEAEQSRAITKEAELTEAIAQEVIDRESGDNAEVEARTAEIARVDAAIAAEIARSEAKEAELVASIEKEVNDRSEADTAIEEAYKAADTQIISDYQAADEAVKEWVDDKKFATVAQLNATEATHQADITRLDAKDSEQDSRMDEIEAASEVTISETAGTGSVLKTYTFTQNNKEIGKINLAKDLVVTGGSVVEVEGEKYLRLTIANQEQPVDIKVTDLVDVYTPDDEYITISEANEISVSESVKSNLQKASTALQEDALTPYRTSTEQDTIDAGMALKEDTYTKSEVDALLEDAGTVKDVKVNDESVLAEGVAVIKVKTVNGSSLIGEGDITVGGVTPEEKALIDTIPSKVDRTELEGYATEEWVEGKGYLTEHQSLASYRTSAEQDTIDDTKATKTEVSSIGSIASETQVLLRREVEAREGLSEFVGDSPLSTTAQTISSAINELKAGGSVEEWTMAELQEIFN